MSPASSRKGATGETPPRSRRRRTDVQTTEANGRASARRELVENEIYEHAARLFGERGFAGTNLQDIADAVGLTRPALYYYVKSKDELLAKLVTEITEAPAAQLREINARTDLDATGKLRMIAQALVTRQASHPARFRVIIRSEAELPEELSRAHESGKRAVLREVTKVVDEGIRSGQFRPVDPRTAALGVIGMFNWVAWWFRADGRETIDSVADQLAAMAVAAVAQQGHRVPEEAGPAAAIALIRQDLDFLERVIGS
ncbi:TetR/AcrR family transcriptional regulator [Saccharopolyspora phatthalungensis]|uniref:AcrR family transcriptional regulator n=1 Tax=Saccharopolyspora phatthalungensis TaxID=664693 RepID=A0A840Q248_9PSEU|nr:TetR/AcrR family transcriptional regulator [Saccharopolyspora phatthalungensis]MBB5153641.1 AcrR family transcriptional regulator [Saccharopolyspora phatthalungensis]